MDLHEFLPFLALSLVLWSAGIAAIVTDACTCFLDAEATIRSMRMPFSLYPARVVVRNLIALAHNVVVIVAVFAFYRVWPGWHAVARHSGDRALDGRRARRGAAARRVLRALPRHPADRRAA